MQTFRYKSGIAVSALLSAALLFMQLCSAICVFSGCLATRTAPSAEQPSAEQENISNHCHQTQPAANHHLPQPPTNNQHNCADHEAAVMLPVRNSLSAVVSLHFPQVAYEPFTAQLANQSVSDSIDIWDSLRSPPRIPQRSVLRI